MNDSSADRADGGPRSHRIQVNGLTCRYLEWGPAQAHPVLLLHGLRSYAQTWAPLAETLAGRHRLIAPDFRGRGESDWDPERAYFAETYVGDVEALVREIGLSRFSIVGHSMGGTVGYVYAARHPDQVDGLVVEDIGPGSSTDTPGADRVRRELLGTPRGFGSRADVEAYWRAARPGISDEAVASRVEHTVRAVPGGGYTWKLDLEGIAAARLSGDPAGAIDLWSCVESLQTPTLVLRGSDSDFLTGQTCSEMARRQPLLTWAEIPAAGHYAHDDNPAAFAEHVGSFLDRVDSKGQNPA